MLIPLILLAVGAVFAGIARPRSWSRPSGEFWQRLDLRAAASTTCSRRRTTCRSWVKLLPLIVGVIGIGARLSHVHPPARPAGAARAARFRALYRFLLNKWYFDELYDRAVRRARQAPRPRPLEAATARSSTASGPTASPPARSSWRARAVRLQTGYLYHYAFAMLIGVAALVTWYLFRL